MPHTPRPADLGRYTKVLVGYAEEEATCGRASVLRNPTFRRPSVLQSAGLLQSDGFLETRLFRCLCGPSLLSMSCAANSIKLRCLPTIAISLIPENAVYFSSDSIKDLVKPASESAGLMRIVSKNRRLAVTSNSIASSVFWLISGMDAGSLFRRVLCRRVVVGRKYQDSNFSAVFLWHGSWMMSVMMSFWNPTKKNTGLFPSKKREIPM